MTEKKQPLVIIAGPTAAGKTALSVALAKRIGGEIISADSMQVYKYMDIGSAKVMPQEMEGVRHYLIDALMPDEEFHIFRFQQMANDALKQIRANGKIPILCGGTGFYIQSLLYQIEFSDEPKDPNVRDELERFAEENGAKALHKRLAAVDPDSAEAIHVNNVKRVIRALEFYQLSGYPISEHNRTQRQKNASFDAAYFVLTDERQYLYEQIEKRVDLMMQKGLLDEVKRLKEMGCTRDMVSMQGLGYKELLDHLDGRMTLDEAVAKIKIETRHFAKRQLTWFRRERDCIWLDKSEFDRDDGRILDEMCRILKERNLI